MASLAVLTLIAAPLVVTAQSDGSLREQFQKAPEGVTYDRGYVEELIEVERPVSRSVERPAAMMRGLDKVSGRVSDITLPVGEPMEYERLTITVRECRVPGEGEAPDAFVLLDIFDARRGDEPVFSGWMFASSPALSAMDHQRYDVWALGCATG